MDKSAQSYPKFQGANGRAYNLTGVRFGSLVAKFICSSSKHGSNLWHCECDCGESTQANGRYLRLGQTKSCGCLRVKMLSSRRRKYNGNSTATSMPEYNIWYNMINRCENHKNPNYKDYGERGITVCESWHKFEAFYEDMGSRPSKKYSLDRRDNDKGYSKDNCRWATQEQQSNNTRSNRHVTVNGETLTVSRMARKHGVCVQKAFREIYKGTPVEDIFLIKQSQKMG